MLKLEFLITLSTRFVLILAGLLTSIITARYLGPAGRGDYFFVMTVAAVLSQLCNFGLQSSNTYLVAQNPQLSDKLTANSFWISLIVGVIFTLATVLFLHYFTYSLPKGIGFTLVLVPSMLFFMLGTNLLVGLNKIRLFNIFELGSNLLLACALILASFFAFKTRGFVAVSSVCWLFSAVLLYVVLIRRTSNAWQFDLPTFTLGFKFAAKVYFITLIGLLVLKGNVFLLKKFCSPQVLGYFSIASQMNDVLIILPTTMSLLLFPNLVRNSGNRWSDTKKSFYIVSLLMLISCLGTMLLIKPFIHLVFGAQYLPAVAILFWMLPGTFFLGNISILSQYLAAIGFPQQLIYIWAVAFLLIMVLSWLLIPTFGAIGAAAALSITYSVLFVMIVVLALRADRRSRSRLCTDPIN
jgi:antigen flippase